MKQITFLLFFSVFSNVSNSKEIDCGIISEAATSITVEEFYFGHHIEVVNISNGPTVSLWGGDEENNISKDSFLTNYLISVGYGDIAEKPMVFRIKSSKKLGFKGGLAKSIVFNEDSLKITLMNEGNGLMCDHFLLNMKQE
jgi:hypothetical protein